jgi:hypothetical protein
MLRIYFFQQWFSLSAQAVGRDTARLTYRGTYMAVDDAAPDVVIGYSTLPRDAFPKEHVHTISR